MKQSYTTTCIIMTIHVTVSYQIAAVLLEVCMMTAGNFNFNLHLPTYLMLMIIVYT